MFGLTAERAYVNLTQLSGLHGLLFMKWYTSPQTRYILEHLEDRNLFPLYYLRGDCHVRIELLGTILTPEFSTNMTPDILSDTVPNLVDYMLTTAEKRMGDDVYHISKRHGIPLANKKVDIAAYKYHQSDHRKHLISMVDDTLGELKFMCDWRAREMLQEISDEVPEVNEIIREIPTTQPTGMIEGARRIIRAIRRQDAWIKKVSYLRTAIEIETSINASYYRLLLAQLMIHSSHKKWYRDD